jgi:lycopene beta-cyclase
VKHYHYIFTGSGLSAMMTVYEMILSGKFQDKTILLLDENPKKTNDRTWCFWDSNTIFPNQVATKWDSAWFKNTAFERKLNLDPYQYKMVKGLDFYNLVFNLVSKQENIHFVNQKVDDFDMFDFRDPAYPLIHFDKRFIQYEI